MDDYSGVAAAGQPDAPQAAEGAALDKHYKITVHNENGSLSAVAERYFLQAHVRELLPGDRCSMCCRARVPGKEFVSVQKLRKGRNAFFGNVVRCERVWICPVCAARISEHRRQELTVALADNPQYFVILVTFTVGHSRGQPLTDVLALLQRGYHRFMGGRQMQAFKELHEVDGFCSSLEVTYGDNGWHPHIHALVFLRWGSDLALLPEVERQRYVDWRVALLHLDFWQRWQHIVTSLGGDVSEEAFDVRATDEEVSDYIAKYGRMPSQDRPQSFKWGAADELTKAVVKKGRHGGRTPFQLLADYAAGDKVAGVLFKEFAAAFRGKKQLSWSNGMRGRLGLSEEKTVGELLEGDDQAADVLAELDAAQWRVVLRNDARGALLDVAASGKMRAVYDFLDSLPGMENCSPHYLHAVRQAARKGGPGG